MHHDDLFNILLAKSTASGLQKIIDSAVSYVDNNNCVCFNPEKTNCTTVGKSFCSYKIVHS